MSASAAKRNFVVALIVLILAIAGYFVWKGRSNPGLSGGFAFGNGRLESVEVDVVARQPGRLAELLPQEGDHVEKGQLVGRIDMPELAAQYRAALSGIEQAKHARQEAQAGVRAAQSQSGLASSGLRRNEQLVLLAETLLEKEVLDRQEFLQLIGKSAPAATAAAD